MDPTTPATLTSLSQWLAYLEQLHPKNIELGLERVGEVYQRLQLAFDDSQVVLVAGTNGKGTTCAIAELACLRASKTVGVYSSPHLLDYRERVRINGHMLDEADHIQAFQRVERARGDISLSYFEFGTLAALCLFAQYRPEILLLEIGLGGRLDAVNIVEPDLSVITTIDVDHQEWLGNDREQIALEKAGILRRHGEAIVGDPNPPQSLRQQIEQWQVNCRWQGRDFALSPSLAGFDWHGQQHFDGLPPAHIPAASAANGMAIAEWLQLGLGQVDWAILLDTVQVPGRCQIIGFAPKVMVDVAHNPQSCDYLANKIRSMTYQRLHLVVGMLADKDSLSSLASFSSIEAQWYLASLAGPRGGTAERLQAYISAEQTSQCFATVQQAYLQARQQAGKNDLIVVFGSFVTVGEVLQQQPMSEEQ